MNPWTVFTLLVLLQVMKWSFVLVLVLVSAPCVTSRVFDDTASFYTPSRPSWAGRPSFPLPAAAAAGDGPSTAGDGPSATVSGASVDVWGAVNTLHRCGSYIASVPDIPARAYDDGNGVTHMIVGSTSYHHMNGSSILNVRQIPPPTPLYRIKCSLKSTRSCLFPGPI